jgi:hypothetical protein
VDKDKDFISSTSRTLTITAEWGREFSACLEEKDRLSRGKGRLRHRAWTGGKGVEREVQDKIHLS